MLIYNCVKGELAIQCFRSGALWVLRGLDLHFTYRLLRVERVGANFLSSERNGNFTYDFGQDCFSIKFSDPLYRRVYLPFRITLVVGRLREAWGRMTLV